MKNINAALKYCPHCKKEKSLYEFSSDKSKRDGKRRICKTCEKAKRSAYYQKNKDIIREKQRKYFETHKTFIKEIQKKYRSSEINKSKALKRANSYRDEKIQWFWDKVKPYCRHCGYNKTIVALEIHHLNPNQKENSKDTFAKWIRKVSFATLKKKLATHDFLILCANCHAELHAGLWEPNKDGWNDSNYFIE